MGRPIECWRVVDRWGIRSRPRHVPTFDDALRYVGEARALRDNASPGRIDIEPVEIFDGADLLDELNTAAGWDQ